MDIKWYEDLYKNSAKEYDKENFVQGTVGEVDFIEIEINSDKTKTILDVGCGTGRHSIELAKRGYTVTGFDLSEDLIKEARKKAKQANVPVDFIVEDARKVHFNNLFDLVIVMCEGGFSLMEEDEMDNQILINISKALKENGKLILTAPNALFQLKEKNSNFDVITLREHFELEKVNDNGEKEMLKCNQRYYLPSEINWRLKRLGFNKIEFFSCTLNNFSRDDILTENSFEMLVIAEK